MDDNSQANAYSNPYLPDRAEFEKAILGSDEWLKMRAYILSVLYSGLQNQAVINKPKGHLLVTNVGLYDAKTHAVEKFHFAILTENGHVAKSE